MALQVQIAARNKIEAELNKPVTNMDLPAVGVIAECAYSGVIRLRERKAIHRHSFCGDVTGRQGVVALAFRSNMMLYPLR